MTEAPSATVTTPVAFGRCDECGRVTFPVLPDCPNGHAGPLRSMPLTESGEIYSWTRVGAAPDGEIIAMADFMEGEVRVVARVVGATEVSIGQRVKALAQGEDRQWVLTPA